jgi:hypothetical protein
MREVVTECVMTRQRVLSTAAGPAWGWALLCRGPPLASLYRRCLPYWRDPSSRTRPYTTVGSLPRGTSSVPDHLIALGSGTSCRAGSVVGFKPHAEGPQTRAIDHRGSRAAPAADAGTTVARGHAPRWRQGEAEAPCRAADLRGAMVQACRGTGDPLPGSGGSGAGRNGHTPLSAEDGAVRPPTD